VLRQEGKAERLKGMQKREKAERKSFALEMTKRPLQQPGNTLPRCVHPLYNLTGDYNKSVL